MRARWYALVEEYTEWCNRQLPVPMRPARVQITARSIARWITRTRPGKKRFGNGAAEPRQQSERELGRLRLLMRFSSSTDAI